MLLVMAVAPQTVYARDGDTHLAYQVGADQRVRSPVRPDRYVPDRLAVGRAHRRPPPASIGVVQPSDHDRPARDGKLRRGADPATVPRCRRGRMGSSRCLTPLGASVRRSSRCRSRRFPPCFWRQPIPSGCARWCSGARTRAIFEPTTTRAGCPSRPVTRYSTPSATPSGRVPSRMNLAPSWAGDAGKRRWWARGERLAGGPGYFKAIFDLYLRTDVRPALDSIQAPTLLLRRRGDRHVTGGHAQYLADRIPNARLVEFERGRQRVVCRRLRPSARRDRIVRHRCARRSADQPRAVDCVVHRHRRIDRTRRSARR